jgi:hypothetical protein
LRRLVVLACAVLLIAIAAHTTLDVIQLTHVNSAAGDVVVCLLIFTVVYAAVMPRARIASGPLLAMAPYVAPESRLAMPAHDRARASPAWMQRFLR